MNRYFTTSMFLFLLLGLLNFKIIFYEYGVDCNIQTKDFSCYLPNKQTLILLYRKCHYDLCYSKKFYNQYAKHLNLYISSNSMRVVDQELLNYFEINMNSIDIFQSKIFSKKNGEIIKYDTDSSNNTTSTQSMSQSITQSISIDEFSSIDLKKKEELMNEISSLKNKLDSLNKKCKICQSSKTG